MDFNALVAFATALFSILNPIGDAAMFEDMVSGRSREQQRAIAIKSAVAVAVILLVTLWLGEQVLAFFGVSLAGLEAAGGLIVATIAVSMLDDSLTHPEHRARSDSFSVLLSPPQIGAFGAAPALGRLTRNAIFAGDIRLTEAATVSALEAVVLGAPPLQ